MTKRDEVWMACLPTYVVNPECISIPSLMFLIMYITVGIPGSCLCT